MKKLFFLACCIIRTRLIEKSSQTTIFFNGIFPEITHTSSLDRQAADIVSVFFANLPENGLICNTPRTDSDTICKTFPYSTIMIIAIAPDKFKGTLTAMQAAEAIAAGVRCSMPDACLRLLPMADGGEGTAEIIGKAYGWRKKVIPAHNALGEPIKAEYYVSGDGKCGVIDSSSVIGLQLIALQKRNPMLASSYPLGIAVRTLLDSGIAKLEIGIGGTATVDAGIGFLQGLGCKVYCDNGELHRPFRACDLNSLTAVELSASDFTDSICGLADVAVPLYGEPGKPSMLMFAKQKGVTDYYMTRLGHGILNILNNVGWSPCQPDFGTSFGGAGGGIGFAIAGALHAKTILGAERVISACNMFDPHPDLIITGEGAYDRQSLQGKATHAIAGLAESLGIPCHIFAGKTEEGLASDNVTQVTPCNTIPSHSEAAEYLRKAVADFFTKLP